MGRKVVYRQQKDVRTRKETHQRGFFSTPSIGDGSHSESVRYNEAVKSPPFSENIKVIIC